jgi:hypothetical protein
MSAVPASIETPGGWPDPPGARDSGSLPVLPALRELLPRGGLTRGSVVAVAEFGLLCLALAAGASAAGAWCAIAGLPEAGVLAAAGLGLDAERTLLVPDPGPAWPQVVASLLDGCEIVLVRPPAPATAQVRKRLEAALRRGRGVLLVAGDWPGAQVRLRVGTRRWTGPPLQAFRQAAYWCRSAHPGSLCGPPRPRRSSHPRRCAPAPAHRQGASWT